VLCVDDGSSDSSSRIARKLGAEVYHHRSNRGYGGALKTIFGTAQERRSQALVILDSDGQHEPSDIPHLLAPILSGEADVVIGSRFVDGGGAENMPAYRALGIKVITAASNLSSDLNIKDTQSGFRAFGPKALERLNFDHDGMESCLEILNACDDLQLKVKEVPTRIRYDVPKGSRYTALSHGFTVFSFALISLSQKKPLLFFGVPGISLLATGAAIGMRVLNELETITDGSVSLSVGPGLTAAWLGMLGMSLCFASLVLHGARRLMRRLLIEEFGMD
jgi:glycosyltransferase involved in cell wall biosynthesis